jgi:hypothetical protein
MLVLAGCLEVGVRTTVNPDCSSDRFVTMKLGNKELPPSAFPAGFDSTWTVEWKEINEKDSKFEYTARKHFPAPEDLSREYSRLPDSNTIAINVSVTKTFRWFFTYYAYDEEYHFRDLLRLVPASDFFTEAEARRFVQGEKSDSLKHKFDLWTARNVFEYIYRQIVTEAGRLDGNSRLQSLLIEHKEECFGRLVMLDSINASLPKGAKQEKVDDAASGLRFVGKIIGTDSVLALIPTAERAMKEWEETDRRMRHPDGWKSAVQMPGLLLETNSDQVEGNTASWKFSADQVRVGDYAMHAHSRVINLWAFFVTGACVALVVVVSLLGSLRARRSRAAAGV